MITTVIIILCFGIGTLLMDFGRKLFTKEYKIDEILEKINSIGKKT